MKTAHEDRRDRMIENFIACGFEGMSREEAMELLLCFAMPSVSMTNTVQRLFEQYGTFAGVINAPSEKLMREFYLDESAVTLFRALPEITKRYGRDSASPPIESVSAAIRYFTAALASETTERLVACFLNDRLGIISCEVISDGDIRTAAVRPLALIDAASRAGSRMVIIAHNHPSQSAQAGEADIVATRMIKRALKEVGITLLDHIIVSGDGTAVSMKKEGYFPLLDV